MLKRSRIIAVLSVCVMMFTVVEPACAWFGKDENPVETTNNAALGWVAGAVVGTVLSVASLGLTIPVVLAGAAAGGAAGMVYGGANEKEKAVAETGGFAASVLGLVKWLALL